MGILNKIQPFFRRIKPTTLDDMFNDLSKRVESYGLVNIGVCKIFLELEDVDHRLLVISQVWP